MKRFKCLSESIMNLCVVSILSEQIEF